MIDYHIQGRRALDGGEAVAGTLFIVFAGAGGWIARKVWLDPGYAKGMVDRGPVGRFYGRKTWRGGVRGTLPLAIGMGLAGIGLFAIGSAGNVRPGQANAGVLAGAACILLFFVCLGCHVTIIWFNRPRWLVPPHMRQDTGNAVAWWHRKRPGESATVRPHRNGL
jgi:hypothetical protein